LPLAWSTGQVPGGHGWAKVNAIITQNARI